MKNLILFAFLMVGFMLRAQFADTSAIPPAWKGESLVILKYKVEYTVDFSGKSKQTFNVLYYLRDKWALDEVSQIDLPSSAEGKYESGAIGAIHKKDGSTKLIGEEHLIPKKVSLDFKTSAKKKNFFSFDIEDGKKLAVPFVEVGDILELSYSSDLNTIPQIIPLISRFSMVDYELVYVLESSSNTTNISLRPTIKNSTMDFYSNGARQFVIKAKNVNRYKEEILNDNLTQVPYAIVSFSGSKGAEEVFQYKKLEGKELKKDQTERVKSIYYKRDNDAKLLADDIISKLRKKYTTITDTLQFADDAYYFCRESMAGEYAYLSYSFRNYTTSDNYFVNVLGRVFTEYKVNYRAFMSQENHYGGVSKNSDFMEPVYGIELPGKNRYYFNPWLGVEPNNIPLYFENQSYIAFDASKYYKSSRFRLWPVWLTAIAAYYYADYGMKKIDKKQLVYENQQSSNYYYGNTYYPGYANDKQAVTRNSWLLALSGVAISTTVYIGKNAGNKKHRKYGYSEETFPFIPAPENKITNEMIVENIMPTDNIIKITSNNLFYGKMRIIELKRLANYTNIYNETKNNYQPSYYQPSSLNAEQKDKEQKRMKKIFKYDLQDENIDVNEVTDYDIQEADFHSASSPVEYTYNYTAKNLVSSSDNYIIVQAGKLIGSQLAVYETSKERTQDFYIPYQKQFERNVKIKVPADYTPLNLDDFNVSKKTPAGEFTATAKIEEGYIKIKTVKTYGFEMYYGEDAEDVYSFLNEATNFVNKKLILKKR